MKWNTYEEYIDERGNSFANRVIDVYSKRKFNKLSQEEKWEAVTTWLIKYFGKNFDISTLWAGARLMSREYTEAAVDEKYQQRAIYDLATRYINTYAAYYGFAVQSGLDTTKLSEHTKKIVKFAQENKLNAELFEKNFNIKNYHKTLVPVLFDLEKEENQPGK